MSKETAKAQPPSRPQGQKRDESLDPLRTSGIVAELVLHFSSPP